MAKTLNIDDLDNVIGGTTYLSSNLYYVAINPLLPDGSALTTVKSGTRASIIDINKVRDAMIRQIFNTNTYVNACAWTCYVNENGNVRVLTSGTTYR